MIKKEQPKNAAKKQPDRPAKRGLVIYANEFFNNERPLEEILVENERRRRERTVKM